MPVYLDVLMLINFIVDLLLLLAVNRLSGYPFLVKRAALAAVLGGIYGGICMMPGLSFLGDFFWRILALGAMSGIAFGFRLEALRRSVLFFLLSMALGGIALGLGKRDFLSLLFSAGSVCFLCLFGLRGKAGVQYVPVEIQSEKERICVTALRDTGNMLTDPLTGQPILVVSARIGQRALGLTQKQIADPTGAIGKIKGGRLVPFHSVGQDEGILLARRFDDVTIGNWHGSCLVAFAPYDLGKGKPYEALTGGTL